MRIIGIDPGYALVGWGVFDFYSSSFNLVDYGAIETFSSLEFSERLKLIYLELNRIIKLYAPNEMAVEKLFFSSNKKTALDVAQARGVILLCARLNDLNFREYTPIQVKQGVVGYGRAKKQQVMEMVKKLLNLKKVPKPDDAADALAVGLAHASFSFSRLAGYF